MTNIFEDHELRVNALLQQVQAQYAQALQEKDAEIASLKAKLTKYENAEQA